MKLLELKFIPRSVDFGLLILRIWVSVTMLLNHGYGKVMNFSSMMEKFPDVLGIGRTPALILIIFAEVICAAMIAVGWYARFAALSLSIAMGVAFFMAHGAKLTNPGSGELAFIYMAVFVGILLAGPGRFSLDVKKGGI
jgi:putative oxidoreductase